MDHYTIVIHNSVTEKELETVTLILKERFNITMNSREQSVILPVEIEQFEQKLNQEFTNQNLIFMTYYKPEDRKILITSGDYLE